MGQREKAIHGHHHVANHQPTNKAGVAYIRRISLLQSHLGRKHSLYSSKRIARCTWEGWCKKKEMEHADAHCTAPHSYWTTPQARAIEYPPCHCCCCCLMHQSKCRREATTYYLIKITYGLRGVDLPICGKKIARWDWGRAHGHSQDTIFFALEVEKKSGRRRSFVP